MTNCKCASCPYHIESDNVTQFILGDSIDISFRLTEVLPDTTYYIGIYNEQTKKCVLLKDFSEIEQIGETSFTLHIPHSVSAILLPRVYYAEIGLKTRDGIVNIIDDSIRFKINKSQLGKTI